MKDIAWFKVLVVLAWLFIGVESITVLVQKASIAGDTIFFEWRSTTLFIAFLLISKHFWIGIEED